MIFFIWPYVEKLLQPWRVLVGKWFGIKAVPQRAIGDMKRLQGMGKSAMGGAKNARAKVQGVAKMKPPAMMAAPPKAKNKMGLFGKKKACPQCGQPQEKGWDQCPYCLQAAQMGAPGGPPGYGPPGYGPPGGGAAAMGGAQRTMAFMAGSGGSGGGMQLVGWIVPIKGPQRGELFTLKPQSIVGTDPTQCDVVLADGYMSQRHAVIKAQSGVFVLEDTGSTNGTFVNDKKVKTQELLDNDYVMFGQTLCKFKSL